MRIEPPRAWREFVADATLPECRLLAHPGADKPVEAVTAAGAAVAAVGPEGGFTDAEVAQALACSWQPVALGPRTLRVETAALVLAAVVGRKN
jgi:16S rRNA (uracil1498-N3)-methyltransferase